MTNLLIVLPDDVRREAVAVLAQEEGLEVTTAASSLHALTQLERNTPDVIICDGRPGDLSAVEFHEIVRSEPGTSNTPMLLITDSLPSWLDARLDVSVPRNRTSRELVAVLRETVMRLTQDPLRLEPLSQAPSTAQMRGTLEIMNLFDLLVSFNQMRKTGRIVVNVGHTEALIYLSGGEVRHVEFGGISGETALKQAFAETDLAPTSSFAFAITTEELVARLPRTIPLMTSRLLLEIAVHLDHVRSERQTVATP